jgi:hypothetical protein
MEDLIKRIEQILDQFFKEELGNRLSQFSMLSLKEMILNEIKNYKPVKNEVVKGDFKK